MDEYQSIALLIKDMFMDIEVNTYIDLCKQQISNLILPIQQTEFGIPITLED